LAENDFEKCLKFRTLFEALHLPMPRLGDILLRSKQLTESQLKTAIAEQQRWGGLLGEILLRMDYLSESVLVDALSRQTGISVPEPMQLRNPEPSAHRRLPLDAAKKLRAIPLQVKEKGKLMLVAMCEPQNLVLLDELRKTTGCRISPYLIGPLTFLTILSEHYGAEDVQEEQGEGSFKLVDAQGRPVMKSPARARAPASPPVFSPLPNEPSEPTAVQASEERPDLNVAQTLAELETSQRQEVAALRAMVELLIERGVFTRDEYLARVRK
jgi:hypothetical protein